ncbi:MAG: redoxin domain-containing protein [Planctomycetes bacterium]|nr:redoxin domain-containing protein [Planctomycetota bacterium]
MTRSPWPAAVLLLLGVATAQQGPPPSPAQQEYQSLVREAEAARSAWAAARKEFTQGAEYQAALAARDAEKLNALLQKAPKLDLTPYADRALELAQRHAGKDEAVLPLAWVVCHGGNKERATRALATLHRQHLASKQLLELFEPPYLLPRAADPEVVRAFLIDVSSKHPDALVRAHALDVRVTMLQRRGASAEEMELAARLAAEAEILAQGSQLYDKIVAPRFERERLQIGMVAPDIEGEDLDGVKFKLSEYRGKVVVLDFWGDW